MKEKIGASLLNEIITETCQNKGAFQIITVSIFISHFAKLKEADNNLINLS